MAFTRELREDGSFELEEASGIELREPEDAGGVGGTHHPRWPLYVNWHLKNCRWERVWDCPPDIAEEIDRELPYEAPLAPEEIRRLVGTLSDFQPPVMLRTAPGGTPVEDDMETVALIAALDDD